MKANPIKDLIGTHITEKRSHSVHFRLDESTIDDFATLTGDRSSLHTNKAFARRSMYRGNIAHGMLPTAFLCMLEPVWKGEVRTYFRSLSARFLKPPVVGDKLAITSTLYETAEDNSELAFEYCMTRPETDSILSTGYYSLAVSPNASGDTTASTRRRSPGPRPSLVLGSISEESLTLDQISRGEERSFNFSIFPEHVSALYDILTKAMVTDLPDFAQWRSKCDVSGFLSICLFSTFVGMCMPGKYATFMDFSTQFTRPVRRDGQFRLKGRVLFKSETTSTIVEELSVFDPESEQEPCGTAKLNVKVGSPPTSNVSIPFLKETSDLQLKDRVALVTGASRGNGEATAKLLSVYGTKVVVNYFQGREDAERIVDEIRKNGGEASAFQADVSDEERVKEMVSFVREKYGRIDILVNNAVRDAFPTPFLELTWDDVQRDMDITVKGAFNCCRAILPQMIAAGGGKIINISTIYTDNPPPDEAKYVISKNALVGLTRSLAVEFAPHNVQVNLVAPSIVATDLTKHVPDFLLNRMAKETPMGRNATSLDIAKAVVFLASSLASFTTGQKLMVTGGNPPFF